MILTGSWPSTSGDEFREVAEGEAAAAREIEDLADQTRSVRDQLVSAAEGRFAGALYVGYTHEYEQQLLHAEFLRGLSALRTAVGDDVDAAKRHMEFLDWEAHEEIAKLEAAGPVAQSEIMAIVLAARADCAKHALDTARGITERAARIADLPKPSDPRRDGAYPGPLYQESPRPHSSNNGHVFAAGSGPGDSEGPAAGRADGQPGETSVTGSSQPGPPSPEENRHRHRANDQPAADGQEDVPAPGRDGDPLGGAGLPGFSGDGGHGGGIGSGGGSGGGLGSGLLGGAAPLSAFQSGVSNPGTGLGGARGPGFSPPPAGGATGGAGLNPVTDFARGFTAGSGGPPPAAGLPPLPPSSPPPATVSAPVSGAPAVSAGSVPPTVSPLSGMVPPPVGAAPGSSAGLAPVGADALRHVGGGSAGAVVSSSPVPTSATTPGSGPTVGGATTVAASAGGVAATASMAVRAAPGSSVFEGRASDDDPVLAGAARLVQELVWGSRFYPGVDWCVGVFRSAAGTFETVVCSSEGAGYVPAGVFLPREARLLFADPLADECFRERWFGWANPVATMVAYAQLRRGEDGTLPLYAVAASSMMSDAVLLGPAERAGVKHVQLCSPPDPRVAVGRGDQLLDAGHVHRLGLVDAHLLAWLDDADRTLVEVIKRCEWLTSAAFSAVSARFGASGTVIPDVGAAVFNQLSYSDTPDDRRWDQLESLMVEAQSAAAAVRPNEAATFAADEFYRPRHDLARLLECLHWWRPVGGEAETPSIRFAEIAYCAKQINGAGEAEGAEVGGG